MKKYSVEIKVIVLITFAVIAVLAAGYLAYNSLGFVLTAIKKEAQPNYSLLLLKEINNNLQKGESYIEYFNLTGDRKYLDPYNEIIRTIDNDVDSLRIYSTANELRIARIDTINVLLAQKFKIWEVMLNQPGDDRLEGVLTQLSNALKIAPDSMVLKVPKSVTVEMTDTIVYNDTIIEEESRDGFFARIFRKKEEEAEPELQSMTEKTIDTVVLEEVIEAIDTSIAVGVDKTIIQSEIIRLKEQEDEKMRALTAMEVSLMRKDNRISNELTRLISQIEKEELEIIRNKAIEADRLVDITNTWSVIFLLMFCNLLIAVVYVIQRYIRKSRATQKALIKAKDAAINLGQAKEQFLANMSHEIRTPMNAIVGFTDQILQGPLDSKPREQLGIVRKSADHLLNIINDILDFSKLEAGRVELEKKPFNAEELVLQAYQLYKPSAELKGVKIKIEYDKATPKILVGDSFRLRQIIFNLLSNAIKFTENGTVKVSIGSSIISNGNVLMKYIIKDSGTGVAEDKLKSIFDEFTQADITTSRNYGGTGLGLAIVRKLVHLHGGKISVKNNEDKGACFTVEIEYSKGDGKDIKKEIAKEKPLVDLTGVKFLIADDDEYNRKLVQHIMEKWGANFMVVSSGKEVLKELEKQEYDVLLLDIHMPELNGYEVASRIRAQKSKVRKIPILALTATVAKDDWYVAKKAGIDYFLAKPYTEIELNRKIAEIIYVGNENPGVLKGNNTQKEEQTRNRNTVFEELYILGNHDKTFVKDMLQMFVKNTTNDVKNIKKAFENKKWEDLAELAHKIKSPCKHLDAQDLANLLKELEMTAREGENEASITLLYYESLKNVDLLIDKVEEHLEDNFND